MNEEEEQKLIRAYQKSGDAKHAYRSVGVDFDDGWVEQKRNAKGLVEILESDISTPEAMGEMGAMELVEADARAEGLYDGLPQSLPEDVVDEAVALSDADRLLAIARETVPQQHLAIFLAVQVDDQPLRVVAKEFGVSYRQVWQIVDSVKYTLQKLAEEYEGTA